MKNLTVKQAEKWLEKIKQTDSAAFKDIGRCLKKFDQTSDEFECFVKMNQVLYTLPHIAQEINIYLEEGNKFLINRSLQERLNSFLDIARQTKHDIFREIVEYVNRIAKEEQEILNKSDKEAHLIFTQGILNIVKEYPVLCAEAQKIIPVDQEEAFKQLDLKHLKNKTIIYEKDEDQLALNAMKKAKKVYDAGFQQRPKQSFRPKFSPPIPSFLTISQEKSFLKQIQKKIGSNNFLDFMKLLEIYHHNIISKSQFISLVQPILGVDVHGFRDIIESRQFDRRKTSEFKPLSDIDFHILPRQTHSYVQMPANYPHYAINRTPQLLSILNNKWVSVPRGSEVTFNVRIKNPYQLTLNKCEDERYQFDLIIGKLRKSASILKQVLDQIGLDQNANVNRKLNVVISMGILQILYKNASKQQKQALQDSLTNYPQTTIKIFIQRIQKVISDLQEHKKFYAIKNWNQASHKNFYKSLDFKNHEFKNYEKNKMKPQSFIDELNYNVKYLESRGTIKINQNPFQGKKQFFSLLNSFEASSRKQRCLNRQIINPPVYDLRQCKFPTLLPAMILGFQDHQVLTFSSTLTLCYIQSLPSSQAQKSRCRNAFKQAMSKLLKIKVFKYGTLNNHYEQQHFFTKILHGSSQEKIQNMLNYQFQNISSTQMIDQSQRKTPNFSSIRDIKSEYNFEPPKNQSNIVFYGSQNFYVFLRYFYALYERILKMKQITTDRTKFKLFQILYFACVKYKQCNKFQEGLNVLFGQYAYLFSTFYKIVEGVCKAVSVVALSPLENYSLGLMGLKNQDVYLLLLNRQMLNIQTSSPRLVRVAFQLDTCLMYIHSFNPFYRFNQQSLRQHNKRRLQMSKSVQTFNTEGQKKVDKKLGSANDPCWIKNNQQYFFFSYSNKLINIPFYEDVLVGDKQGQNIAVEIEKVKKIRKKFV